MQKIIVEQGGVSKELNVENNYSANGWTLLLVNVADGADKVVQKIADLVGGTGTKPSGIINKYLGSSGLVSNIADATNIKGLSGDVTPEFIALAEQTVAAAQQAASSASAAATSETNTTNTYNTFVAAQLKTWALSEAYTVLSATRNTNNVVTTASVKWPDGTTGTFIATTINTTFNAIDAYTITYDSDPVKTITQSAVTRNSSGAVTAQPELTIS